MSTTQTVHLDPPLEAILLRWPEKRWPEKRWLSEGSLIDTTRHNAIWRMLVGSQLRRGATRAEVDAVWPAFFLNWSGPEQCRVGIPSADEQIAALEPLPGRRQKVGTIRRLARVWEQRRPPEARVASLPGCRQREQEAYAVFAEHSMRPLELTEPDFARWHALRCSQGWSFEEETAIVKETLSTRLEGLIFTTSEADNA